MTPVFRSATPPDEDPLSLNCFNYRPPKFEREEVNQRAREEEKMKDDRMVTPRVAPRCQAILHDYIPTMGDPALD